MGEENGNDVKHLGLDVSIKEWIAVEIGGRRFRFRINRRSGNDRYKLQINAPLDFTFTREGAILKGPRIRKPGIRIGKVIKHTRPALPIDFAGRRRDD